MRSASHTQPQAPERASPWLFGSVVVIGLVVLLATWLLRTRDVLAAADQETRARWKQLESTLQQRLALSPDLVAAARWEGDFEPTVLAEVAAARAHVVQFSPAELVRLLDEPALFMRFQNGHERLALALQRLITASEAHPTLGASPAFQQLRAQLTALEARLALQRLRYNDAARVFNAARNELPAMFVARAFRGRFDEKPLFLAPADAELAPGGGRLR